MSERKVCGAKLRGKDATCKAQPMKGKERCRIHGGLSVGIPGNQNARKHGLYSTAFDERERELFNRRLDELLADPAGALLADAAALMAKCEAVMESSRAENGMLLMEIEDTTGVGMTGQPVELKKTKRVNLLAPLSDVLFRASVMTGKAFEIDPNAKDEKALRRRKLSAEAAVLEKEAQTDATAQEPIEIIVREYKEPPPDDGGQGEPQ